MLSRDYVEFIECCVDRDVKFLIVGYPPVRIDLITSATGIEFDSCWENRMAVPVGRVEAGFISYLDLIKNKKASARPQDLVDVQVGGIHLGQSG
jgi:hypothetical protein